MTGAELAEATGLSEATISRLASGDRRPSLDTMKAIAVMIGWSVNRQLDALDSSTYGSEFKTRMERRPARART